MADNGLVIAACVAPIRGLDLDREKRIIKPALLYGDSVKLYSPKAFLLSSFAGYTKLNSSQQLLSLFQMAEPLGLNEDLVPIKSLFENYELLKQLPILSQKQRYAMNKFNDLLNHPQIQQIREYFEKLAVDSGIRSLDNIAKSSGLLEILHFSSAENALEEWFGSVLASGISGSEKLLLDIDTSNLIKALDNIFGLSKDQDDTSCKAATVAASLFRRLPTFESASIDEIIDIRKELEPYLKPFRMAIQDFSDEVESQPWEPGFASEVGRLATERLDPLVQGIEDISKTSSGLRRLIGAAVVHTPWHTLIGCVLADLEVLPGILGQLLGTSGILGFPASTIGVLKAAIQVVPHARLALEEWKQEKQGITKNRLYFYHQLKQRFN